jgi:hypothetical protein
MTEDTLAHSVREENSGQPSVKDQVRTAIWFARQGITPASDETARKSEIEDALGEELEHTVGTVVRNLEDADIIEQVETNVPPVFILKTRTGDFLMGEDVDLGAHVDEERERFLADLHAREKGAEAPVPDGGDEKPTMRDIAAAALGVTPDKLEEEMARGDERARMEKLDEALGAIIDSDEVTIGSGYDQIGFRNAANHYQLTSAVAGLPLRAEAA